MKKKNNISKNDQKNWEEYLKNPRDIFDKDNNLENSSVKNSRFKFDLHGYGLSDANKKVRDLINSCYEKKYKEIILITGKGIHSNTEKDVYVSKDLSKLRYSIPDYINSDRELFHKTDKISVAGKKDGGDGVIIIKLKKL